MVFGDGACSTHLSRTSDGEWVKHWWNLLSPHVRRHRGCTAVMIGVGADGPSRRRRDPNFGVSHSLGISPEDMLEAVLEAEEEERHLRRLNTYNASDPPAVVDRRVQAARDVERVLETDEAQNEADSLLWDEVVQAAQMKRRRQAREEEEAAKVAARIEDWAVWKNAEDDRLQKVAAAARLREGQDWAAWTNAQVRAVDEKTRQRPPSTETGSSGRSCTRRPRGRAPEPGLPTRWRLPSSSTASKLPRRHVGWWTCGRMPKWECTSRLSPMLARRRGRTLGARLRRLPCFAVCRAGATRRSRPPSDFGSYGKFGTLCETED